MKSTFNTDTIKKIVLLLSFIGLILGFQNLNNFAVGEPNGRNNVNSTSTIMFNMEWNQTFGGLANDGARSIIGTSDGGYAIIGWTYGYISNEDIWLVKTDANGQAQWNTTYGGMNTDSIRHLATDTLIQTADGGFVLFGGTKSYGAGDNDFWLIKTDANGQVEWNTTYGGALADWPGSFIQTADGGYALTGNTDSYGAGNVDGWLVKTDVNGQVEWNTTYGGTEYDNLWSVVQTADGGYVLAGNTESYGAGNRDGWLVKTDINGQAQWNYTYGGIETDSIPFLIQLVDGGYVLAGNTEYYGQADWGGAWLLKMDVTGQVLWNYTYGGRNVFSLIQTADGGYALTGYIAIEGSGKAEDSWLIDCWLIKIDANGKMVWEKIFGGKEIDVGSDLLQAADGDLVIAGWTGSYGAGNNDMWLLKTADSPPPPAAPGLEVVPLLLAVSVLVFWRRWKK